MILRQVSVPLRHELMCLSKIFGHPFVDMEKGSNKLFNKTTMKVDVDPELVRNCTRYAKRSYIKHHLLKHKTWPPCHFVHKSVVLTEPWKANKDPDSSEFTSIRGSTPIEEYDAVELEKNMEFNYIDNILPYLKDKTISLMKSTVFKRYMKGEFTPERWEDTRLLLYYLLHDLDPKHHQEYLKHWTDADVLEKQYIADYLAIRIVPKEKELKEEFRGFGCKTYEDRMRTICQELNVADYLDTYCSEQALTLSELEILKRLSSFRRISRAYKGYVPIYIVIDASSWNNKFRHESVAPVMEETLDKIFGVKIFSRTMLAYENALIYVPDADKTRYWDGQFGGIEGLNQYTWDTVYLPQIRACLHSTGYEPKLFVKGDDLRAVVLVPPDLLEVKNVDQIRRELVETLTSNMEKLGHDININESYGSLYYFAFSKVASVGTVELPEGMRKIQKAYGANNAFLPFLDEYIGSAFSISHSSSKASCNPVASYTIGLFWSSWHLIHAPRYSSLSTTSLAALLLVPSLLGGFPIIYLHNIWVRAESDLFSPFLGLMKYCEKMYPHVACFLKRFLNVNLIPAQKGFTGLLTDPYSLPIQKPSSASTILRKMILPALRRCVKNKQVIELFEAGTGVQDKDLIACLSSSNVYNARVLSAIYSASPSGLLTELLRKFESGRSILELLILRWGRKRANRSLMRVMRADDRVHDYRIKTLTDVYTTRSTRLLDIIQDINCPAACAQKIREACWGKPIESVTMPPLQHQVSILRASDRGMTSWEARNSFQMITQQCKPMPTPHRLYYSPPLPVYETGDFSPFCGYSTRSGTVSPALKLIDSNELLSKVKTLLDLYDWVNLVDEEGGVERVSNLPDLIKKILRCYVPVNITSLLPFQSGRKSGTIEHHIRCRNFRESIMPNILGNIFTKVEGITNSHVTLRTSNLHHRVNYLHIYCFGTSMLHLPEMLRNKRTQPDEKFYLTTTSCEYCCLPITEHAVVVDQFLLDKYAPKDLHYLSLSDEALAIIRRSLNAQEKPLQQRGRHNTELPIEHVESALIQHYVTSRHSLRTKVTDFDYHHPIEECNFQIVADSVGMRADDSIGFGELKRIRTDTYLEACVPLVIKHCYKTWPDNTKDNITSYMHSYPATTYNWYDIIHAVYEMGRLTHIVTLAYEKTHIAPPNCQESVASATVYVGICCYFIYHNNLPIDLRACYFSNMLISDFEDRLKAIMIPLKHRWIKMHLYPLISSARGNSFQARKELYAAILLYWTDRVISDSVISICNNSTLNTVIPIQVFNAEDLSIEAPPDFEDTKIIPRVVDSVFASPVFSEFNPPINILQEVYDNFDLFDQAQQLLANIVPPLEMEVLYTTLSECINCIRLLPVINASYSMPSESFDMGTMSMPFMNPRTFAGSIRTYTVTDFEGHGEGSYGSVPVIPKSPFSEQFLWIRTWHYYRCVGFGTSSPSKLMYVLNICGLLPLPKKCVFWCTGDGLGGFAETINHLTSDSLIVFNTLIVDPHREHHPSTATRGLNRNTINYESMNYNLSDLTDLNVIESLYEYNPYLVSLITCDAQTIGMNLHSRYLLLRNIVYAAVKYGRKDVTIVLKLYLNEHELNLNLIYVLNYYGFITTFVKPPASGFNSEVYIAAQRRRYIGDISEFSQCWTLRPPSVVCYTITTKLTNLWDKDYQDKFSEEIPLRRSPPIHEKVLRISLPLAIRKMATYIGVTLNEIELANNVRLGETECVKSIFNYIKESRDAQWSLIKYSMEPDRRYTTNWDVTTLAHKLVMIDRWLCSKGFEEVLLAYVNGGYITNQYAYERYSESMELLREYIYLTPSQIYMSAQNDYKLGGTAWSPFRHFLNGVELALAFVGYFSTTMEIDEQFVN
ncbi:TPA_asm: RNA-dependent RNA polymerase [Chalcocoris rutilans mononega-like virus 2]|nr:TPA_asm: RNA-dependent RNA polymerase [Chalcocoris rutilans mononega-like virus 2]